MTKLGLHVQSWLPGALDSVLRVNGPILKVMSPDVGPVRTVLEERHDVVLVCRRYFDDWEQRQLLDAGRAGGEHCAELVASTFMGVLATAAEFETRVYLEGLNEIGLWDDADKYCEFTIGFATKIGGYRARPAVYSFATGNPPGYDTPNGLDLASYWAHFVPGLYAAYAVGGALAVHEYAAPSMRAQEGWLCLRYRKALEVLPAPLNRMDVLITECGIDGGTAGAISAATAGWRSYATPEQYAEQLRWYDSEISKDPNVIGATVFTVGGDAMWGNFDITGVDVLLDACKGDDPMPHRPTLLTVEPIAPVQPGGFLHVKGSIVGLDGPTAALTFIASYPKLNESQDAGQAGKVVYQQNGDGAFDVQVPIGMPNVPMTGPLTGTLDIYDLELDPEGFAAGAGWGEMPRFSAEFTILAPASQPQSGPTPDPALVATTAAVDAARLTVFTAAGDGYNADHNPIWLEIQKAIDAMKMGQPGFFGPAR